MQQNLVSHLKNKLMQTDHKEIYENKEKCTIF